MHRRICRMSLTSARARRSTARSLAGVRNGLMIDFAYLFQVQRATEKERENERRRTKEKKNYCESSETARIASRQTAETEPRTKRRKTKRAQQMNCRRFDEIEVSATRPNKNNTFVLTPLMHTNVSSGAEKRAPFFSSPLLLTRSVSLLTRRARNATRVEGEREQKKVHF